MRAEAASTWAMTLMKMPMEHSTEPTYPAVGPNSLATTWSRVTEPLRRRGIT